MSNNFSLENFSLFKSCQAWADNFYSVPLDVLERLREHDEDSITRLNHSEDEEDEDAEEDFFPQYPTLFVLPFEVYSAFLFHLDLFNLIGVKAFYCNAFKCAIVGVDAEKNTDLFKLLWLPLFICFKHIQDMQKTSAEELFNRQ